MLQRSRNSLTAEKKPHVCILEDDAAVRDSLRLMLERNGFSTRTFSSPNEFLMSREMDAYDCLIIDFGLPGMNGLELLELLRARTCWTPAILIAASADAQTEPRMRKAGASELLMKPIAPDLLLTAIRKAAGRGLVQSAPRT
jgi:FixJ family two-component response regulator